jgi:hypothetical protein
MILFLLISITSIRAEYKLNENNSNNSKYLKIQYLNLFDIIKKTTFFKYHSFQNNYNTLYTKNNFDFIKRVVKKVNNWDIIVPDDFNTIQDAINHSREYYTIYVRSGIYHENIIVNVNALNIIGENLFTTIVDGREKKSVFKVNAFLIEISGFNITNGEVGLSFGSYNSTFNNIHGNTIYKNDIGINIEGAERSNIIYQNNFIKNNINAYDNTDNTLWYDKEIKNGNYWDDYIGIDNDDDGIGDIPYNITGNRTQDIYPLMMPCCYDVRPYKPSKPIGSTKGKIDNEYFYKSHSIDPEGDRLFYWFDWNDQSNCSWIGPFESGIEVETSHIWNENGSYKLRVRVKNEKGLLSSWSDPLVVRIPKNKDNLQY